MKKLTLFFFALLAVCLAFQACDNSKTYAEMLEEEKDAIKAFIKDSSIVVISQSEFYAQDSTTDVSRNEYVQLASGVYMQIVDKGSTNPADTVKPNDLILVRFEEQGLIAVGGVKSYITNMNSPTVPSWKEQSASHVLRYEYNSTQPASQQVQTNHDI